MRTRSGDGAFVEESREAVVVLDDADRVLLASRRARQTIEGIREGERVPPDLLTGGLGVIPFVVPYEVDGRRERLVYLSREGDLAAYEELRSGFTAAVSHELRTPLARLLTLLESTTLPGEDVSELVERATSEVEQITELIDEVLFLSELESGYFGYSYYEENQSRLNAVQIRNPKTGQCVAPGVKTVQNGTHKPLARPLFIYANGSSFKRTEVQAFLDYIFDHEAQIANRARFVPLTKAQLKRAQTNFDLAVKAARRS